MILAEVAPPALLRPLWRNRDFLLLWDGQAVSLLGTQVSTLALPLLMLALTRSPAQAGLVASVRLVPYLALGLPAGALIDRWDRRWVMVCCNAARGTVQGTIPLAFALGQLRLPHLYAVALVEGAAFVFFDIANTACLPRVVPDAQLPRAAAINAVAYWGAQVLGPGLAGVAIGLANTTVAGAMLAYTLDGASYAVSVIVLLGLRTSLRTDRTPDTHRAVWAEVVAGLRFLWRQRVLRALAFLHGCLSLLDAPVTLAVIVLARDYLHADARTLGVIFAVGGTGGVVGALLAPSATTRLRVGTILLGTVALEGLAMPIIAMATSPALLMVGTALMFLTFPLYGVAEQAYRLAHTPDDLQGRVSSVFRLPLFTSVGTAVGGVFLGLLGPRTELWLIGVGLILSALAVGTTALRRA
jgi:MFS family permease